MEPASDALRLRLVLGKFQVTKISKGLTGFVADVNMGFGVTMQIDCPINADLRLGDWLTFYTECPHAQPNPPPIQ